MTKIYITKTYKINKTTFIYIQFKSQLHVLVTLGRPITQWSNEVGLRTCWITARTQRTWGTHRSNILKDTYGPCATVV